MSIFDGSHHTPFPTLRGQCALGHLEGRAQVPDPSPTNPFHCRSQRSSPPFTSSSEAAHGRNGVFPLPSIRLLITSHTYNASVRPSLLGQERRPQKAGRPSGSAAPNRKKRRRTPPNQYFRIRQRPTNCPSRSDLSHSRSFHRNRS